MRVVLVGSTNFSLRCLESVLSLENIDIAGVITNEEKFSISYAPNGVTNVQYGDVEGFAAKNRIPLYRMKQKMNESDLVNTVKQWQPELILVVGWYHMIPKVLRDIAPAAGLHASLLPDYSGGAPLVWAIINGENKTGITFFFMDDEVDSGPVIGQLEEKIKDEDTISTLYERIEKKGVELITNFLPKMANSSIRGTRQDESRRRIFPQRSPEDGQIKWEWSANRIYNFIRAQTRPYPGAFTYHNDSILKIWQASVLDSREDLEKGQVLIKGDRLLIGCRDGCLEVTDFELTESAGFPGNTDAEKYREAKKQ